MGLKLAMGLGAGGVGVDLGGSDCGGVLSGARFPAVAAWGEVVGSEVFSD